MIWLLYFILLVFLITVIWLLIAPFQLMISSDNPIAIFRWKGLGDVVFVIEDEPIIRLRIWFWRKLFYPFQWNFKSGKSAEEKEEKKKAAKKPKPKKSKGFPFKLIRKLMGTFKVRAFRLNVDTDDYAVNGMLYPLAFWLSKYRNVHCQVNFEGDFEFFLFIENQIYRLAWVTIRHYIRL